MMRHLSKLLILAVSVPCLGAAEPAFVELVDPERDDPWLGQRLDFAVEVAVRGRFSGSAKSERSSVLSIYRAR